jgi:DNA-binding MarR family transcriptional regulator
MAADPSVSLLPLPCADYPTYRQIVWDVISIMDDLDALRSRWARKINVTGPQWKILMAIVDLDQGRGVPVGEVSAKIRAVSTFVTTQTKLLERKGLLRRVPSDTDARVVLMSLSERAMRDLAPFFQKWGEFYRFIFGDFSAAALRDLAGGLDTVKRRTRTIATRAAEEH